MALVLACGLFMGLLVVCSAMLLKWNDIRYGRTKGLPPGTMGWPFLGETIEFLKHGPVFMKKQKARYGSVFRSHILGSPTIICMDPELNRYILYNEGKGLVPGYPQSLINIVGKHNPGAVQGAVHKHIRGSLLSSIGPSMVKDHLFLKMNPSMTSFLENWQGKTIDIQEKTFEMALVIPFKNIIENESDSFIEKFKSEFDKLLAGTFSVPFNIPGTKYHCSYKARKEVIKFLKQIMKERRASSTKYDDILGRLLSDESSNHHLSDEEMIDQIITILYSGYETVSTTTMMAVKYLHDHPKALQELREEHFAIQERKKLGEPIDWEDYKTMRFTRAVIFETSRLATVVNGLLRKAEADIELNGYVIPKGWRIYVFFAEINSDPFLYPEPLTFNPWRWLDKSLENHNYFFLFGAGGRLCPGKELGIATISLFLHFFVTQYRWEEVGRNDFLKFPRVEAPNGLHIKVSKY